MYKRIMKENVKRGLLTSGVLLLTIIFAGSAFAFMEGMTINPEKRIDLAKEGDSGLWKTNDLVVIYDYDREMNRMDISGKVRFYIGGSALDQFYLTIYILDKSNKIVNSETIAAAFKGQELKPISFEDSLELSKDAAGFTFGYVGESTTGGGSRPTSFGESPGK